MGYHPRIETKEYADFFTTRTTNSRLWFINNQSLQTAIVSYAAKYATRYNVSLYALAIEGNHIQGCAQFHEHNRRHFMRDFNSAVARAVPRHCRAFQGGALWARRYSNEFLPDPEDLENWFFYTVLQPVQDGLVEKLKEYPGYNCFRDAIWGIKRTYTVMNWSKYYEAKRYNPRVRKIDYLETYQFAYKRLPGYEELSQKEYAHLMMKKLEERRRKIVAERYEQGRGFAGRTVLKAIKPGARPKQTKTSTITSHRPRVLCICAQRRAALYEWYFSMYFSYKEASLAYRSGEYEVEFPQGMYKPPPLLLLH